MKKMVLLSLMLCAGNAAWAAQGASNMSYQGKLLDKNGIPQNGAFTMIFSIYNVASGGSNIWTETVNNVQVGNGFFSVPLGNVTPLGPAVFASSPTYLGVQIQGEASEMTPRQLLAASPYAFSAAQLVSNSAIPLNAGVAYATFTTAGNWQVPFGISAASGTFSSTVTVNGKDLTTGYSLQLSSGITMPNGTLLANVVQASSGVFTAAGPTIYSLSTSSGIFVGGANTGVTAPWFSGTFLGAGMLTGGQKPAVPYWTGSNALSYTSLDYDSAQSLTLYGSSLTVNGNLGQSAANSVMISSQVAAIAGSNGVFFSTVVFATATGNGYYSLVASSGIQVNGTLDVNGLGGVDASATGIRAATGTFIASGNTQYSLYTSSGISVGGTGGVTASWFSGTFVGAGVIGGGQTPAVPYWTAGNTLGNTSLKYDSAQSLTVFGSSLTVNGNLGQSAANSVLISSQVAAIAGSNGVFFSTVVFATATGNGYYSLVASSGIQVNGTLDVNGLGGIDASGTGIRAATGTFTASGNTQYSLYTSSGISVGGTGGVTASWFSGTFVGAGVIGGGQTPAVPYWTSANALGNTSLKYDSAQSLTVFGSSLTVSGNLGQSAANSVMISSQVAAIAGSSGIYFSTVVFATATGNGYYSLVASSGIQVNGTLDVNGLGGVDASGTGIRAATGTFTASGNTQYSLYTSSGISVGGTGGVTASWFSGTFVGPGLLAGGQTPAVPYWTAGNTLGNTSLKYDSAQSLTVFGSSLTVNGSLGQSAANSVLVSSQVAAIAGSSGIYFSTVVFATATGNGYYSLVASSGIQVNGTLDVNGQGGIDASATGIRAATGTFIASGNNQYSLYTSSGIQMNGGTLDLNGTLDASGRQVFAATGTFAVVVATGVNSFSIKTSSGIQVNAGTLAVIGQGGIDATGTGIRAATATLTGAGNTQYSLYTSSGISVGGTGGVTASWFAGSGAALTGLGVLNAVRVYTSNGTWTRATAVAANVSKVYVQVVGGGGGGGSASATTSGFAGIGGSGGGGGYAAALLALPGADVTVTVSTGANGGLTGASNAGTSAAPTSFGASVVAAGGVGGVAGIAQNNTAAYAAPGSGGVGTTGDFVLAGSTGTYGLRYNGTTGLSGDGGKAAYGGGGAVGVLVPAAGSATAGNTARNYGGGGSGAAAAASGSLVSAAGGNGAGGLVLVWEFK